MPYRRMKLYVGIFITLLVTSVGVLSYVIMDKKGYFDDYATFYFRTNNATSFFVGMPVNYSGFEIGSITQRELTSKGEVRVTFKVKERDHKWICKNTFLILEKPLIGVPIIEVKTLLGNPKLSSGSEVPMIIRDDINDIIVHLRPTISELQQAIHSVNRLTSSLASKGGALEKSMANVEHFSSRLASDQPLLTTMTGDPQATEAFNSSLRQSVKILDQVHSLSTEVERLLVSLQTQVITPTGEAMKATNGILTDIKQKLESLDNVVATLGSSDKELLLIKNELRLNLDKTHRLLEKVDAMMMDKRDSKVILP